MADLIFELGMGVASVASANGTLVSGQHNPVDATGASRTMALPATAKPGARLSVEKVDSSANTVAVFGSIRGISATVTLNWQSETIELLCDAVNSWHPIAGHKTKTALDAAYDAHGLAASAQTNAQTYADSAVASKAVRYDAAQSLTTSQKAQARNNGGLTQGLLPTPVKTGLYTAVAGDLVISDTTNGAWTLTLPATASRGDRVGIKNFAHNSNALTVRGSGSDLLVTGAAAGALTTVASVNLVLSETQVWVSDGSGKWYVDSGYLPTSVLAAIATSGSATDLTGLVPVANVAAGAVLFCDVTSSNFNTKARPTARTDVRVFWTAPDSSHFPTNAITNDYVDIPG